MVVRASYKAIYLTILPVFVLTKFGRRIEMPRAKIRISQISIWKPRCQYAVVVNTAGDLLIAPHPADCVVNALPESILQLW